LVAACDASADNTMRVEGRLSKTCIARERGDKVWTPTRKFLEGNLVGVGTATPTVHCSLKNSWLGLYTNTITPTVDTLLADLDAANFVGYALSQLTWNVPFTGEGTLTLMEANKTIFRSSDTTTPNTIKGGFIVGDDSVTLLLVEPLTTPVNLPGPDNVLSYTPRVGFDPTANYGLSIIAN
jgi:hypothetical protein